MLIHVDTYTHIRHAT